MRFLPNDAKWSRRAPLKNHVNARDVRHHNTLNATGPSHDEVARSREVERFFDLMTPSVPSVPSLSAVRKP